MQESNVLSTICFNNKLHASRKKITQSNIEAHSNQSRQKKLLVII